ncbi:hypothetical protein PROFUN_16581 [Planoprotostelium fungivorum]|uniref:CUB domain-containing protein n=1 Tax=Planoprotostelium fungivorum TaxID=1890364 RepID=A0A2P6MPU5_9EUKA|nr:hypothetical protein PROFUN_16581 [Planoprotostelium fungivorum]
MSMLSVWTCLLIFFIQGSFSTNVIIYDLEKNYFLCTREAAQVVTIVPIETCIQGFNTSYFVSFSGKGIGIQTYRNFRCYQETPGTPLYTYEPGVCGLQRIVDIYDGTLSSAPGPSDSIQELYLFPNCGTSSYQGTVIQYAVACTSQTSIVHDQCQTYMKSPFQQYYKFTCGGGSARYRAPNEAPSTVLVYYSFDARNISPVLIRVKNCSAIHTNTVYPSHNSQLHYTLYKLHTEACISRKATSSVLQTQHFASYSLQRLQEDVPHCTSEASCRLSTSQDTLPVVRHNTLRATPFNGSKKTSRTARLRHRVDYLLAKTLYPSSGKLKLHIVHATLHELLRPSSPPSKSFVSTNYVVLTRNVLVSKKVRFVLLDTSQDDPTASSDKKDPLHRVNDGSTRRLQHHVERRLHQKTSASCKTTAPPEDFSLFTQLIQSVMKGLSHT